MVCWQTPLHHHFWTRWACAGSPAPGLFAVWQGVGWTVVSRQWDATWRVLGTIGGTGGVLAAVSGSVRDIVHFCKWQAVAARAPEVGGKNPTWDQSWCSLWLTPWWGCRGPSSLEFRGLGVRVCEHANRPPARWHCFFWSVLCSQ